MRTALGHAIAYEYDQRGLLGCMDVDGQRVQETTTYNVDGTIQSVSDVNGTAAYTYHADGTFCPTITMERSAASTGSSTCIMSRRDASKR